MKATKPRFYIIWFCHEKTQFISCGLYRIFNQVHAVTVQLISASVFATSDSTTPLLPVSVAAQAGLCQNWSETPKTGFLASWLILSPPKPKAHNVNL